MNAEMTEIASRFAKCQKWKWLPGMLDSFGRRVIATDDAGVPVAWIIPVNGFPTVVTRFGTPAWAAAEWDGAVPDLGDPLTRLGCLAVVRLAWGTPNLGIWGNVSLSPGLRFTCGKANGRVAGSGPTEEAALLAALEAAPK